MCGRFTLRTPAAELVKSFRLLRLPELTARYNIAPTQPVAAIRAADSSREWSFLQWGLIPSWVKDPALGSRTINARSETVAIKPTFRSAFRRRRCLIPADGFYEWKKSGGRTKQPYYILMADERPFAFAGLWERWERAEGTVVESCTIITTGANDLLRGVHDRMPVILNEEDYDVWLDRNCEDRRRLQSLLVPYEANRMRLRPIGTLVNNARNDTPECIAAKHVQGALFEET